MLKEVLKGLIAKKTHLLTGENRSRLPHNYKHGTILRFVAQRFSMELAFKARIGQKGINVNNKTMKNHTAGYAVGSDNPSEYSSTLCHPTEQSFTYTSAQLSHHSNRDPKNMPTEYPFTNIFKVKTATK